MSRTARTAITYTTDQPHDVTIELTRHQGRTYTELHAHRERLPIAQLSRAAVVFTGTPHDIADRIRAVRDHAREAKAAGDPQYHYGPFHFTATGLGWIQQAVEKLIEPPDEPTPVTAPAGDPEAPMTDAELFAAAETMARVRGSVSATYTIEYRTTSGVLVTRSATWKHDPLRDSIPRVVTG